MARLGCGFGQPRRQAVSDQNFVLSQSMSQAGVTFTFSAMRPADQYANGDLRVVGPVAITSITPASTVQTSGTYGNGAAITSRVVHGAVVNPGNRVYATGRLTANNPGFGATARQGFDSITSGGGIPFIAFQGSLNVDPGATGVPLSVATGSVVKLVSRLTGLLASIRWCSRWWIAFPLPTRSVPVFDARARPPGSSGRSSTCRASTIFPLMPVRRLSRRRLTGLTVTSNLRSQMV